MSIEDIVDLTIVVSTTTLTRPGFGTPLALVSTVPAGWGVDKVRTFSKLAELVDAGFTSADPAYKLAAKIKAQNPCPKTFKIAKRDAAKKPAQSIELVCLSATEGDVYSLELGVGGGATTAVTYTVPAASTTSTVATALEVLIEAVTGVSSAAASATITVTPATAGDLVNVKAWSSNIELTDATPDPGVADDLDDVLAADSDWYGLLLDSNSEAEIAAAAGWTESNRKLFIAQTSDAGVAKAGVTNDVASDLKALTYDRTALIYNGNELLGYSAAAWMGRCFPFDPGSITWAFKVLTGVSVDALSTGQRAALEAKNVNFYENVGGENMTRYGKLVSGEWIDTTHFVDWLDAEMRLQVLAAISSLPKLPYTNAGLGVLEGTIKAVLKAGIARGGLVDNENLFVTMPALADIDAVTKATRTVPDIEFGADLAGAIHKTSIAGTLTT